MEGIAKQKVPGGKLITVKLSYSEKIQKIEILGDFFVYPESGIETIEKGLIGMNVVATEKEMSMAISKIAEHEGIEMIGITPDSIASTIATAVKG